MSMEECLLELDEALCFQINGENVGCPNGIIKCYDSYSIAVMLREYGHCPVLHYIRGVGEVYVYLMKLFIVSFCCLYNVLFDYNDI
jgi:hypothetical protein